MKVLLENQYEVEVHDKIAERFMTYSYRPLASELRYFLFTDFGDFPLEHIFSKNDKETITKTLNQALIEEIWLREGSVIYTYLDSIGYKDYLKAGWANHS